jgi:cytochrome P450
MWRPSVPVDATGIAHGDRGRSEKTAAPRAPVIDFDHHSHEYWLDIEGYIDRARHTARVGWSPHHGGFWVVTRAEEAKWVAQHPEIFSSGRFGAPEGHSNLNIPPSMLGRPPLLEELDPPEHAKYRQIVNLTLAPRQVKEFRPNVAKRVSFLIDRFIETGACDFVTDLTSPVSALMTLDLLGFPADEWERYSGSFHNTAGNQPGTPDWQKGVELVQWVNQQCIQMVEDRKRHPTDDVTSRWLAYEIDGRPISTERVAMLLFHFMGGGTETTGSLTASVLKYLGEHPDVRRRLIDDPNLLDSATEEFLRVFPPAKAHGRVVVKDTELAGCQMKVGDKVLLSWVSVNRDEEVFGDDSAQIVLDRFPNRHSSFSSGPHRCPGSHLARAAFQEAIRQVLARIPDYRIVTDAVTRFPKQDMLGGYSRMPAVFTPGARANVPVQPS